MAMKPLLFLSISFILSTVLLSAQHIPASASADEVAKTLVDLYARAREEKDTLLLNRILTADIDQLVSSGEWRRGLQTAKTGMLRSSENNPGDRSLTVEEVRELTADCLIADARYRIRNEDGSVRNMWSTFLLVRQDSQWKIAAIRNMLPAGAN